MVQSLTLPSVLDDDDIELYLGERELLVRVLQGHTGSDSQVVVPDAGVVFTGDLFWNHSLPNLVDANTAQQIRSDDVLAQDYPNAVFVPGHGEIGRAADVRAFRDYLAALREAVGKAQRADKTGTALVAAVMPGLKRQYGNWNYFDYFAEKNIAQTAAELAGTKRYPSPSSSTP